MKTGSIVLCWILQIALSGVFLWAGWAKLLDPPAFAEGIAGFQFFPAWSVNLLAMTVPVTEIFAALLLLTPKWSRQGALLGGMLAAVFVLLFVWAGFQDLTVHCSCFGGSSVMISPLAGIVRGAALCAMSGFVFVVRAKNDFWPNR